MMDTQIDKRFKRSWDFFLANAGGLLLGSLVVLVGWFFVIPGPWFSLNLLQEALDCARTGRSVRWQAAFDRQGNFLKSWGLTLAMGISLVLGYLFCIVPGVLLSLYWFHAPMLAADGRGTLDALAESGRLFRRGSDWAAYFLNWLVLAVLSAVGGSTAVAVVLSLPLSLAYLVFCYLDEADQAPLTPPRREVVV